MRTKISSLFWSSRSLLSHYTDWATLAPVSKTKYSVQTDLEWVWNKAAVAYFTKRAGILVERPIINVECFTQAVSTWDSNRSYQKWKAAPVTKCCLYMPVCMYVCMHVCMYVCTGSEASVGGDSWELTLRQNGTVHSPWPELPTEQYSSTQWSILQQANCNQLQAPSGPTAGRITAERQAWRDKTRGLREADRIPKPNWS